MTREQAQDIVNNQGFAWTVTEVVEGDAFNMIYCDWKGKEHLMYYSNNQNKICRIEQYNKTIISMPIFVTVQGSLHLTAFNV